MSAHWSQNAGPRPIITLRSTRRGDEPQPASFEPPAEAEAERPRVRPSRRRYERYNLSTPVVVIEVGPDGQALSRWECRIVDLSRGGMGLRSKRMVHLGRRLLVEMPLPGGAPSKIFYGVVRQSRYAEGEGYAVGLEFEKLPPGSLMRLWRSGRRSR